MAISGRRGYAWDIWRVFGFFRFLWDFFVCLLIFFFFCDRMFPGEFETFLTQRPRALSSQINSPQKNKTKGV